MTQSGQIFRRTARWLWPMLALFAVAFCPQISRATATELPEYDVKAAFLFNFTKYLDWPPQAFPNAGSPIVIGVLGNDPFGPVLDRLVQGRTVNGRRVVVRRANRPADLQDAHLVFISPSEAAHAFQLCSALQASNILSVGDTEPCAGSATIYFSVEGGRIVFSINLASAERAGVKVSSKLLHLAKSVRPAGTAR